MNCTMMKDEYLGSLELEESMPTPETAYAKTKSPDYMREKEQDMED